MDGFYVGQKIQDKLGMRASPTAELVFENVFVPQSNVVGGVNEASICMVSMSCYANVDMMRPILNLL